MNTLKKQVFPGSRDISWSISILIKKKHVYCGAVFEAVSEKWNS